MIQTRDLKRCLLCAPLLVLAAMGTTRAAVNYDVAVGMNVGDDARIFLNVTNETWRPAPTMVTSVIQQCSYPEDDFPVIAFLAYQSHRPPTFILNLRNNGYSWSDIFFQLNVDPSVLFVGIDRDPGPPYGRAWGYWRAYHRPGPRMRYRLADRDIVGLVKVQTVSRHFGMSPIRVIQGQPGNRRVEVFAANQWREKHGRKNWGEERRGVAESRRESDRGQSSDKGKGHDEGDSKGHGKGKGKGSGKGHGHGKGGGD